MNISSLFIRRPVATTLVMFAILMAGAIGYRLLPVADLPTVDFPTIEVTANLSGANADTMATSVATPIEKEFSTIAGLDSMTSVSGQGTTRITLQFALNRDIDAAALDVQSALSRVQRRLPSDMTNPPSFRKVNPADAPVFYLSLSSKTMRLSDVTEYGENFIGQRLSMIDGVAQVMVYGSQKYAVRVHVDPQAMAAKQIGIDEVADALRYGNVNLPVGSMTGPYTEYTIQSSGKLMDAAAFQPLIVAWRNGAPVRIQEIGTAVDSVENDRRKNWFDGVPGVTLAIQRQPGSNTVAVVDSIKNMLPSLRAQVPAAIDMTITYDRSKSIRESVRDVQFTMMLTICLVILVIFLFLRNIPATVIPSLAVPLSVMGTFAVMQLLGFSVNNLTLMALTLAVSFVVDDAIVMLENIVRHMEQGKSRLEAAFEGSREIGFTILSMTISLTAVFIPVLFMGGIVGRLFHEFAVTVMTAILLSGFVSLTLTPMMCGRFLTSMQHTKMQEGFSGFMERLFDAWLALYKKTLEIALLHKGLLLLFSGALLFLTGWLFTVVPKGFIPLEDNDRIVIQTEGLQGSSFENMARHQQELVAIVAAEPAVEGYMSVVGPSGGQPFSNSGTIVLRLTPKSGREHASVIINRLRQKFSQVPGIRAYPSIPPSIRIGGSSTKSLYQFTMQSPNTQDLYDNADAFLEKVRALPHVADVATDLQIRNPEVHISIDRDKASALGITAQQLEDALSSAYSTREVSSIRAATNDYSVLLLVDPVYRRNPEALKLLYVRSKSGQLVPLSTLVQTTTGVGPMSVNHSGQLPSVTVSFNLAPGYSLGQAVDAVQALATHNLPASVSTMFQGTAQAFQDSFANLWLLMMLAILVIYIVLGILYESFIHPITILSGLPSAGVGALITLLIFGKDLDIYAFVGIIMLIGIVKKNAIMMIDFALEAQRKESLEPEKAIYAGAIIRFRPIMMTTMAALMGCLPIALGHGAGAESRQPLGLAVVGGLLVSQLLTLYLTPVYYIYLDRLQRFGASLLRKKKKTG
ncbi:multidrug efflux system, subunit B [uncultured delta proteobacterium]|uniref:Multidrug efflux system, subunit B n=1 Tax=uncultured delta proteobacterium TaxID=34034 RepID=A0A212JUM3_9DELT|nr:multidrug efflux system, subunit B [uncultured delta proteobacterium]